MRRAKNTVLRKISIQVRTLECTEFFGTSFQKEELPNLLNAKDWPVLVTDLPECFHKSICLYLTTTKYGIWKDFLPRAQGRWYIVPQPLMFPFLLFYFSSCFWGQNLCLYIFPLHLLMSTTQQYLSSYVWFWRSRLSKLLPKTQTGCDLIQNKRRHGCDVFTPQPNTIYLVLQLGIEDPPRDPGWCYPKVWEVFTGFPRGTREPQSHFLLPPSQTIGSWLPNPHSQHSYKDLKSYIHSSTQFGAGNSKALRQKTKTKTKNPFLFIGQLFCLF